MDMCRWKKSTSPCSGLGLASSNDDPGIFCCDASLPSATRGILPEMSELLPSLSQHLRPSLALAPLRPPRLFSYPGPDPLFSGASRPVNLCHPTSRPPFIFFCPSVTTSPPTDPDGQREPSSLSPRLLKCGRQPGSHYGSRRIQSYRHLRPE
ncbi:hypothetical protein DPEC_G00202740 [Dallia pectoralis]|uniref:Uncharacterized protein n=1 Tax=Dallia pectoralis TaxID=75939 RepID=A0ACC2G9I1_DALPE|nr:hypothetical protein DPEC_G00202740 [Dallia pectoralis]